MWILAEYIPLTFSFSQFENKYEKKYKYKCIWNTINTNKEMINTCLGASIWPHPMESKLKIILHFKFEEKFYEKKYKYRHKYNK